MEANTDRGMWGIIALLSAILIGGVIIVSMPQLTGKIANEANKASEDALKNPDNMEGWMVAMNEDEDDEDEEINIDDIIDDQKDKDLPKGPNEFEDVVPDEIDNLKEILDGSEDLLGGSIVAVGDTEIFDNNYAKDKSFVLTMDGQYNGLKIVPKDLKPNTTYKFSYTYREITSKDHELVTMGSHVDSNWVPSGVFVDGVYNSPDPQIWDSAYVSGIGSHDVELYMHYLPSSIGGERIPSETIWIQPNRGRPEKGIVKISNIKLEEMSSTTPERIKDMKSVLSVEAAKGIDKSLVSVGSNEITLKATPESKYKRVNMIVDGKAGKIYHAKMKVNSNGQQVKGSFYRFIDDITADSKSASTFFHTTGPTKDGWIEYDLYLKLTSQDGPDWSKLGIVLYGNFDKEVKIKDLEIFELGYTFD